MAEKTNNQTESPEENQNQQNLDLEVYQTSDNQNDESSSEEQTKKKSNLPKGFVTQLVVNSMAQVGAKRYKDQKQKEDFMQEYTNFVGPWITALEFEEALSDLDAAELPPQTRLAVCGALLLGGLFLVKPAPLEDEPENQPVNGGGTEL